MVADAVKKMIGSGYQVKAIETEKNNGVLRKSVYIKEFGSSVAPNFYIDELLEGITSGHIDVMDAAARIAEEYKSYAHFEKHSDIENIFNREKILKGVVYKLVNKERNEKRLAEFPHKDVLDLAAVYCAFVDGCGAANANFTVSRKMCIRYGITLEELDRAAVKNTESSGFVACSMASILEDAMDSYGKIENLPGRAEEQADGLFEGQCPMTVLTNSRKVYGAAVMMYPQVLKSLAQKAGYDLYILPSSIHEVIAVPVNGEVDVLRGMVQEINSAEVQDDEILSDNVYRYRRSDGRLVIA